MKLFSFSGKLINKNVSKYLINWEGGSLSQLQFKVKQFFMPYWKSHIVYEEFPVYGTLLKVDILNATLRIAVEIQGEQHYKFHYFHNNKPSNYLSSLKRDFQKMQWLEKNNFQLIEIMHDEVDTLNKEWIKEKFSIEL